MTEEKAIDRCNELIKTEHTNWIGISNQEAIEKVLNMLKEKDEEIEYYKKQKDYDMKFRHELLKQIRCLNLNKDEKDRAIEKLKKHNKELLRKLKNRVKEIKKLNKYNLYKKRI